MHLEHIVISNLTDRLINYEFEKKAMKHGYLSEGRESVSDIRYGYVFQSFLIFL